MDAISTGEFPVSPAQAAFDSVKKHFEQDGILTPSERHLIKDSTTLDDVQKLVNESVISYRARVDSSKIRRRLFEVSEKICHYGTVLDVFVQHHPEYVSLAWGTMKLLFAGVINHGETLKTVAKAITQAADRLPRISILSSLYPSEQMKYAVENLYSCILEFLLKAYEWAKESKLRHLYHSLTRPPALQYEELLALIAERSNVVTELASVGSQTEIRTMNETHGGKLDSILKSMEVTYTEHKAQMDSLARSVSRLEEFSKRQEAGTTKILALLKCSGLTINELVTKIEAFHSIQTSAQLDTNQRLSDLQASQAMSSLSSGHASPDDAYRHHLFHRNRRSVGMGHKVSTNEFWLSPKLGQLASGRISSIISIRGPVSSRPTVQDFGLDIITTLRASRSSIIWALTSGQTLGRGKATGTDEMMKQLTWQALRLQGAMKNEKQMALRISQFQSSQTIGDWVGLFKDVILGLITPLYVVIDLATVAATSGEIDNGDFNFVQILSNLIRETTVSPSCAPIKIVLLAYEAEWYRPLAIELPKSVVLVRTVKSKPQQSRKMRNDVQRGRFRRLNLPD